MSSLQALLWLCLAAYGVHILEEFAFDWRNWAHHVLGLLPEWSDFYVTNALVVVLGIVAAEVAPLFPVLAMGFPALMLINAVFFHIAPVIWTRGRFSPGLITAVLLFFPAGIAAFRVAGLNVAETGEAFAVGAGLMAAPILFLKLRRLPYFDQTK
jgi:hypothetical protein